MAVKKMDGQESGVKEKRGGATQSPKTVVAKKGRGVGARPSMGIQKRESEPLEGSILHFIPPDVEQGPCFKKLSDRHKIFVMHVILQGNRVNWTESARAAGYLDNDEGTQLKVHASRLKRDPRIQAAIQEESKKLLWIGSLQAAHTLLDMIGDGSKATDRNKINAAMAILDRGGVPSSVEHTVNHHHNYTLEEKIARVRELCSVLGQDPETFLGGIAELRGAGRIIEGEAGGGDGD
jgi:phage terminase small subunit